MAGFEVTAYGRFWVTAEGQTDRSAPRSIGYMSNG